MINDKSHEILSAKVGRALDATKVNSQSDAIYALAGAVSHVCVYTTTLGSGVRVRPAAPLILAPVLYVTVLSALYLSICW